MNDYIRSRIFIDGMVMKDIYQIFDRLDKINLIFGEVLDQNDWQEIFENTRQASMLIPPMNEQSDTKETYYVVERDNRYVDGVFSMFAENRHIEKEVSTTKSLLECDRYKTYEEAQEFADKYDCNVRKVIVKVEEWTDVK